MSRAVYILSLFFCPIYCIFSQENILPKGFLETEKVQMDSYLSKIELNNSVITDQPSFNVRTMAEWEEIQALTIAWEGFEPILTEIVRNSVDE